MYPKVPIVIMKRSHFLGSDDFTLGGKPYIRPSPRLSSPRFWSSGTLEGALSVANFLVNYFQRVHFQILVVVHPGLVVL